jgi:hypothetical protein
MHWGRDWTHLAAQPRMVGMARWQDPRRRLADDARRAAGYMQAVAEDARRQGAELPEAALACVTIWRSWSDRLATWAGGGTDKGDLEDLSTSRGTFARFHPPIRHPYPQGGEGSG